MSEKIQRWCAVPGCMSAKVEKRHFFRFPKEYNRWLQWIQACKRMDLTSKGPNYAYQNCKLCHLHFEDKWLIKKTITRLHPDAIPTIFFGPAFDKRGIQAEIQKPSSSTESQENTEPLIIEEQTEESDIQSGSNLAIDPDAEAEYVIQSVQNLPLDVNAEADVQSSENLIIDEDTEAEPSTSSSAGILSQRLHNKKLRMKIVKLKKQNNKMRQLIMRLRRKEEKRKKTNLKEQRTTQKNCEN